MYYLVESVALRGSFLIDKDGTVRHAVINDLPLGRNIDEMIRMVDTMLFTNEHVKFVLLLSKVTKV